MARPDGDPDAIRLGARRYGEATADLGDARFMTDGLNLKLAEPYAFVGPSGDRFRGAVASAGQRLANAQIAFDEVSQALHALAGPVEDFNEAKDAQAKAEKRFTAAKEAYEAKQEEVGRVLRSMLTGESPGALPNDPSTSAEAREYEDARQALSKARHRFRTAETRKKAAVRSFVVACQNGTFLAPALPVKEEGPYGGSTVGKVLNAWSNIGKAEVRAVTHPWEIPGSVANGLGDAGKGVVGGLGFLGELGVENSAVLAALGMDGKHDKTAQLEAAARFAKEHPGAFAKAVANTDMLQEDPIRWLTNLAPEVVLAAATGGTSAAATRSGRLATDAGHRAHLADLAKEAARADVNPARARVIRIQLAEARRRGKLDANGTPYAADPQLAGLNSSLVTARTQVTDAVQASRRAQKAFDDAKDAGTKGRGRADRAGRVHQRTTRFGDAIFTPFYGRLDPFTKKPIDPPQVAAGKDALNKLFGGTVGAVANPQLEGDPKDR